MVEGFTKKEKLTFKDIVLGHLKKILEISCNEFRGGYNKTISYNPQIEEYIPDMRKCFVQSVETFALILTPHFDDVMVADYKNYKDNTGKIHKKLVETIKNKNNFKTDSEAEEFILNKQIKYEEEQSKLKLPESFILFADLNKLLKRNDYLKSSVYGEQKDDVVNESDGEEE